MLNEKNEKNYEKNNLKCFLYSLFSSWIWTLVDQALNPGIGYIKQAVISTVGTRFIAFEVTKLTGNAD